MFFGILARKRGDYAAARRHLDRSIALDLRLRPSDHSEVQKKRLHREYVEYFAGNYTRAAAGLTDVLATLERTVGAKHPLTAQTRGYLAEVNGALGRHDQAEVQFQQALAGLEASQGQLAALYLDALRAYGDFLARTRGVEAAKPVFARLAEIESRRVPLRCRRHRRVTLHTSQQSTRFADSR